MEFIDIQVLENRLGELRPSFHNKKPFKYVVFEGFFLPEKGQEILENYPGILDGVWDGTTYIDQRNKYQKTKFETATLFDRVFKELNSDEFTKWLTNLTGIEDIIADPTLLGGGLHQSINGAYLNVHIDYNLHHNTKQHRRLNVLVYMNPEWREDFGGQLELWDFSGDRERCLESVAPTFNRAVIFETNEISFHGHPKPLRTPEHLTRKSIATYYYTDTRPQAEIAPEHNTIYVNTEGSSGQARRFSSGVRAFLERVNKRF